MARKVGMAKSKHKPRRGLYVYQYQFLDDLSFIQKPSEVSVFADMATADLDRLVSSVREQFSTAGWEGDGEIGVIWLPPFVDAGDRGHLGNVCLAREAVEQRIFLDCKQEPTKFRKTQGSEPESSLGYAPSGEHRIYKLSRSKKQR
jgi:hypothetical protein